MNQLSDMSHNENSLSIQSFNYLMYQLHHFFNYERRRQQFVDKTRSRRRYFNLCHQKKRNLLWHKIEKELTVRDQP